MLRIAGCCLSLVLAVPVFQEPNPFPPTHGHDIPPDQVRLPNGKLQQDELLKSDHERSLEDARQLVVLAQSLQKDLEQAGPNVLTLTGVHKTEEIEKLAKRIRGRLRRY